MSKIGNGGICVLVVDDDPDVLSCNVESLASMGETVLSASSPAEALTILGKEQVDIVLCDIVMPGESGLDLLARVRATGNHLPFVFLTGFRDVEHINDALLLGASAFLEKPCTPEEMVTCLWRALEAARLNNILIDELDRLSGELPPAVNDRLQRAKRKVGLIQADSYLKRRSKRYTGGDR